MILVGIDPGSQRVGYAAIEVGNAFHAPKVRELGMWDLMKLSGSRAGTVASKRPAIGARLEILHELSIDFFEKWNPRFVGIEKVVHFKNAASAQTLSEARGVVRLAMHQTLLSAEERLIEISPTAIKKTASGFGLSSKKGVLRALELRFPELAQWTNKQQIHFDAYDALAIALTGWMNVKASLKRR